MLGDIAVCSGLYSLQSAIQCAVNIVHLKGGGIAGYEVVQCSEGYIRPGSGPLHRTVLHWTAMHCIGIHYTVLYCI